MDFRSLFRGLVSPMASPALSRSSSESDVATSSIGTQDTNRSTLFENITEEPLEEVTEEKYILVVGGAGYIGSHTTLELLKEGYNVLVVDDLSNAFCNVLDRVEYLASEHCREQGKKMSALKFHEADYKSPEMRAVLSQYMVPARQTLSGREECKIKGVIHFAAFKSVEESISNPIPYYLNNVCGMVNFLEVLKEFGIKNFVFSSSATVYGTKADDGVPLREEMCVHEPTTYVNSNNETVLQQPGVYGITSPYGRTKWMCEAILFDIAKSDPTWNITALRYFNPVGCHESGLLGEDPRQKPTNLIPVVIRVLTGAKPKLDIFGTDWDTSDGTAVRDFIHVVDLARGHIAALAASAKGRIGESFRTYNLGTGSGHTVQEVVDAIQRASDREIPVNRTGRRNGDVGFCIAGVDRAKKELEWQTVKTLDDCARDVWHFTSKSKKAQDPATASAF